MRLGGAHLKPHPRVPTPLWRVMFSDHFCFGFPPETWALEAYHRLLQREMPQAHWMVAALDAFALPAARERTSSQGGGVRYALSSEHFWSEVEPVVAVLHELRNRPHDREHKNSLEKAIRLLEDAYFQRSHPPK